MSKFILVNINCLNCRAVGTYEIEEYVSLLKQHLVCECGSTNLDLRSTRKIPAL